MFQYSNKIFFVLLVIGFTATNKSVLSNEAYFDLSDNEIEIQTNFNGKEVIIFGLTEKKIDTILTIKGPTEDAIIQKKERVFGFWFKTKKIIYKNLPSIFFIASSAPVNNILNEKTIIDKAIYFDQMLINLITQRNFNFNEDNNSEIWDTNLINIKKNNNFYKEYKIKIVDDKLFQTRIFFPPNTKPGVYDINIYQIQNKLVISEKNKKLIIKKAGLGNQIYNFAHNQPVTYGIVCILFAVFAGLLGAAAFRRL